MSTDAQKQDAKTALRRQSEIGPAPFPHDQTPPFGPSICENCHKALPIFSHGGQCTCPTGGIISKPGFLSDLEKHLHNPDVDKEDGGSYVSTEMDKALSKANTPPIEDAKSKAVKNLLIHHALGRPRGPTLNLDDPIEVAVTDDPEAFGQIVALSPLSYEEQIIADCLAARNNGTGSVAATKDVIHKCDESCICKFLRPLVVPVSDEILESPPEELVRLQDTLENEYWQKVIVEEDKLIIGVHSHQSPLLVSSISPGYGIKVTINDDDEKHWFGWKPAALLIFIILGGALIAWTTR